jgi:hypothetical protein
VDAAIKNQLPAMFWHRGYVGMGGLVSYGPSYGDIFREMGKAVEILSKRRCAARLRTRSSKIVITRRY